MKLLALIFWEARAWYLRAQVGRIARRAPLHPERLATERELAQAHRAIARVNRSINAS